MLLSMCVVCQEYMGVCVCVCVCVCVNCSTGGWREHFVCLGVHLSAFTIQNLHSLYPKRNEQ